MRVVVRDGSDYRRVRIFVCPRCSQVIVSDADIELCDHCEMAMSRVDGHFYIPRWVYEHMDDYEWCMEDTTQVIMYRQRSASNRGTSVWKSLLDFPI